MTLSDTFTHIFKFKYHFLKIIRIIINDFLTPRRSLKLFYREIFELFILY